MEGGAVWARRGDEGRCGEWGVEEQVGWWTRGWAGMFEVGGFSRARTHNRAGSSSLLGRTREL